MMLAARTGGLAEMAIGTVLGAGIGSISGGILGATLGSQL
jgi:hypothetical protein